MGILIDVPSLSVQWGLLFRSVVKGLDRRFAWIACSSSDEDGDVLASIWSQLERFGKPNGNKKVDRINYLTSVDFLHKLPGIDQYPHLLKRAMWALLTILVAIDELFQFFPCTGIDYFYENLLLVVILSQ